MTWQYIQLSPKHHPPVWQPVLAHRSTTKYVQYGNGYNGPERRNTLTLDYWNGRWQHVGSGSYIGYFPILPLNFWNRTWDILDGKNYVVYIERPHRYKDVLFEGLFAARAVHQIDGQMNWVCLRRNWYDKEKYFAIPQNSVSHWMLFPTLKDVPTE